MNRHTYHAVPGTEAIAPSVPRLCTLRLKGIDRTIVLPDDPELVEALSSCIHGWPSDLQPLDPATLATPDPSALAPLCVIEPRGPGIYRTHSRYLDRPFDKLPAATAICTLLADLSQAYSETPGDHVFGLHCGAVTICGTTLVLAGARRAGKSTLVARLSAFPEVDILCDDVLPIAADGRAVALGLAPRLRLPLPESASPAFRQHVTRWLGPADDRYGYLPTPNLLSHGKTVPAHVFLLLDRRDEGPARLHGLTEDETLCRLLERSIAGPAGPEPSFAAAHDLAKRLTGMRLVYSDLEEATTLLLRHFGRLEGDRQDFGPVAPPLAPTAPESPETSADIDQTTPFVRASDAAVRRVGDAAFIWRPGDVMLWHLNPVARAIWAMLDEPAPATLLVEVLGELFPDETPERLASDLQGLMARLCAEGLIHPAG